MRRETRQEAVPSELDVEQYLNMLSPAVQATARSADVLLVPKEFGEEHGSGYFPESTSSVFKYLKAQLPADLSVEAMVDDDQYAEYSYRSTDLILPIIFAVDPQVSETVVAILADYIKNFVRRRRTSTEGCVISELHVTANGMCFKYEGPADTFERSMMVMIKKWCASGDQFQ